MRFYVLLCLLLSALQIHAQPPDSIIRPDTLFVGDTIQFPDSVKSYIAEFYFPSGKTMTVRGVTTRVDASSRAPSGTRISITELKAVNRFGKNVRLKKRYYYVK